MIKTQYGITQVRGCLFELMADCAAITEAVINASREDGMNDEEIKVHLQTAFETGATFADGKGDEAMKRMTDDTTANITAAAVVKTLDDIIDGLVKELKKESERQ